MSAEGLASLRIAALVKQVPATSEAAMGENGRLRRDLEGRMDALSRRALAKGLELAEGGGGVCHAFTMGPPQARGVLAEALALGARRAVHLCDPALAGSDALSTAWALSRALSICGPYDLILCGEHSTDGGTAQVPSQLAELTGLALVSAAAALEIDDEFVWARCQRDDGWAEVRTTLPCIVSVTERLCRPLTPREGATGEVGDFQVRVLQMPELGAKPWEGPENLTEVTLLAAAESRRARRRLPGVESFVEQLVALAERSDETQERDPAPKARERLVGALPIGVAVEEGRDRLAAELLGEAARLGAATGRAVWALAAGSANVRELGAWGADFVCRSPSGWSEEVAATAVAEWAGEHCAWALLGPATSWGRQVMGRAAARLRCGLVADAVALGAEAGRLAATKGAPGGASMATIAVGSQTQMATLAPGAGRPLPARRSNATALWLSEAIGERVRVEAREREPASDRLGAATVLIGVGQGAQISDYGLLEALRKALGAELVATRKVTDLGWLPRWRQVGVTGRSVAPSLYLALGVSGSFNHLVGVQRAGTIAAVNSEHGAPIFEHCDIGVVADWRDVAAALLGRLGGVRLEGDRAAPLAP